MFGSFYFRVSACFLETPSCDLITAFIFQATPDLLKGPQELTQQSNEETAKQILYNYLKEGLVIFLKGAKYCPFWWGLDFFLLRPCVSPSLSDLCELLRLRTQWLEFS